MFTHIIRSGGRKITYQNAGVDCAFVGALSSGFCNWRIDFIESFMVEQQDGQNSVRVQEARRRQVGFAAFVAGVAVTLAFFAFFPGLPHIIDWGAILLSLAVGGLAQWGCRSWMTTAARKRAKAAHDSSGRDTTTDWPPLLVGALIAAINAG